MKRMMMVAIGALPIVAFSLLPKPASAETGLRGTLPSPVVIIADRADANDRWDNNDRNRDDRNRDWRDRNWRDRNDRRDNNARYDDRHNDNSNWRNDSRRDNYRRVWIPAHWESGFLGIGRKWVAGHYERR